MSRACSICTHLRRPEIDQALIDGLAYRAIARQFDGTSRGALSRHTAHIPEHLKKAAESAEEIEADKLVVQLKKLNAEVWGVLRDARQKGNGFLVLQAVARAQALIETQAKLIGQLNDGGVTINLIEHPEWVRIRTVILTALEPHPEARLAIAAALTNAGA